MSLLAAAGLAGACAEDTGTDTGALTYHGDVRPILEAKCVGCHSPEGIAPFALQSYVDVAEHATDIVTAVEAGIMPPWPPNAECNEYFGDRSLWPEQKAVFRAWVDGGMREGDADRPGAAIEVEKVQLSRVDAELGIGAPYTPNTDANRTDDYRCFVIPWTQPATAFVTGFRAVPGNPKIVHHVVAFLAAPDQVAHFQDKDAAEPGDGYTCFGGPGGADGGRRDTWLGAWAPGTLGSDMPAGTGLRVEPGSAIILQVHYNVVAASPAPDQTHVQLKLDATVEKEARVQPWANPSWISGDGMLIPAGAPEVTHSFEYDASLVPTSVGGPGGAFSIWSAGLHMHQLGTHARVSVERAGGGSECLLQIDDWNFHWQGSYSLREPVPFHTGDRLRVECSWDNSPENQGIVGGQQRVPQDVTWGEGTSDEMCLGVFYVVRD